MTSDDGGTIELTVNGEAIASAGVRFTVIRVGTCCSYSLNAESSMAVVVRLVWSGPCAEPRTWTSESFDLIDDEAEAHVIIMGQHPAVGDSTLLQESGTRLDFEVTELADGYARGYFTATSAIFLFTGVPADLWASFEAKVYVASRGPDGILVCDVPLSDEEAASGCWVADISGPFVVSPLMGDDAPYPPTWVPRCAFRDD